MPRINVEDIEKIEVPEAGSKITKTDIESINVEALQEPQILSKLEELIPVYKLNKDEMADYKNITDIANTKIKELMIKAKLSEFVTAGLIAKYSVTTKETFDMDKLLTTLKALEIPNIIKMREYVDMDALEDAIYHKKIKALDLLPCQILTPVPALRVTRVKIKKEKK